MDRSACWAVVIPKLARCPILKDAIAIYVDGGTTVFFRYGIPDEPSLTIAEGIGAAWNQAQLKITARNYPERLTITQPMFLMS